MERIIEVFSWIGAIQGMLLVLLLITRERNRSANRLLASFIVIITLDCLEPLIIEKDYSSLLFKLWEFLWGGLIFLHGPLLFLYVRKMTTGQEIFTSTDLKHYSLPLIYFAIVLTTFLFAWPERGLEIGMVILHELFFLHLLIYSALSLLHVHNYQRNLQQDFVSETINLRWLRSLLIITLCLYVVSFLATQISLVAPTLDMRPWHIVIQFFLVFTMYAISYKSISQPQIFFQVSNDIVDRVRRSKAKYHSSSLDHEHAKRIQNKLIIFMEERKPYLDPHLSLETVAKEIDESRYHISQVINENLNSKFNDFVNGYRIAEFKLLITKPRRRKATIETLARLSGFNSMTPFHTIFKKATGNTPSKFCKDAISTFVKPDE